MDDITSKKTDSFNLLNENHFTETSLKEAVNTQQHNLTDQTSSQNKNPLLLPKFSRKELDNVEMPDQIAKEIRMEKMNVKPATGKLGVLCVGLGAVTSTFMTGVLMARKGLAKPVGSMTQYDKMRVGRGENKKYLHYGEIVPLANLNDIVFGAWDVYPANAYESAVNAEVLKWGFGAKCRILK